MDEEGQGDDPDKIGNNRGNYKPGKGQFDGHETWKEASEVAKNIARENSKSMLSKAANEAKKRHWGSVPHTVRKSLKRRLAGHVDWKKVLPYFIKAAVRSHKRSTVRRVNKKYPYVHPGRKVMRTAKIAISIDQSGSVSDEMLEMFFGQLNKLAKLASFYVVPFDTEVDPEQVYEWKKGENRKHARVRYGGTCFDAPTKFVNEKRWDGHIILTDLEAPKPIRSRCPRMWMTTEYYASRPYFKTNERIIVIK
jgi:predicted metal-dependent peptidase